MTEPVRQALAAGAPLNIGRRALMIRGASGERLIELSAAPIRMETGESLGAVVLLHDVTEMRGLARQMSYQATHDALTGLVNRHEFERRLQEAMEPLTAATTFSALCYLDLDRFKIINDSSGHHAGERCCARSRRSCATRCVDSDTVARIGGDEFGLLLAGCPLDKARQIADDVIASSTISVSSGRTGSSTSVRIGLVEISHDSGSMEEALASADSACYVAKRHGGHVAVYSARDEASRARPARCNGCSSCRWRCATSRFELYCQPIVASYARTTKVRRWKCWCA